MAAKATEASNNCLILFSLSWCSGWCRLSFSPRARSNPQESCEVGLAFFELALAELHRYGAVLDDVEAVGERRREAKILLDHQDRVAPRLEERDRLRKLLHDHRRQAFGDLVEEEELCAGPQDARDGE